MNGDARRRRSTATLLIAPLLLMVAPRTARAQVTQPQVTQPQTTQPPAPKAPKTAAQTKSEAGRLKSAADVLMDQDRYADALVLYERAYELSPEPALLYNQGRAHEALGSYPQALELLERFEQEAPASVRARVPGLHQLIADLHDRMAAIIVKTNTPNARVLLRQKDEGVVSGERRFATRSGQASLEVSADGYETLRRDFDLSAGATVIVDANLVLKRRDALIVVRTTPSADVLFDGQPLGRAPLQLHATPGSHELVAIAAGYYEERVAMTLALGDRRDIELELRKTPGIASTWWFWTAIGAVVVGGVTTAAVVMTEKPHHTGTLGSVAAP